MQEMQFKVFKVKEKSSEKNWLTAFSFFSKKKEIASCPKKEKAFAQKRKKGGGRQTTFI